MAQLSSSSLSRVETAARRYARFFEGFSVPATLGIDVTFGAGGSVRSVALGDVGARYELERLDAETIAEAMIDAAGAARSGPRNWRRL